MTTSPAHPAFKLPAASQLVGRLFAHAAHRPQAPAVLQPNRAGTMTCLTWEGWLRTAAGLARHLRQCTPEASVVLLGLRNVPEFHIAWAACLLADRMVYPISPETTPSELAALLAPAPVRAVVGETTFVDQPLFRDAVRIPQPMVTAYPDEQPEELLAAHTGRGALLLTSSGTTGLPKIVRRSTAAVDVTARICAQAVGMRATDRVLLPIVLCHSYGIEHGLLAPLYAGCAVELQSGSMDIGGLWERLRDPAITILPAVPFVFEALARLHEGSAHGAEKLALRRAYTAGSVLPAAVTDACRRTLGIEVGQVYGCTEFGSATFNDPLEPGFAPQSAGQPMDGVCFRIVAPAGEPRPGRELPPEAQGQVQARSPTMFEGYLGQMDAPFTDGWFDTGDLGRLDSRGRLWITGRTKLLIDIDGRKVNPLEIEAILSTHPDVEEAAVIPLRITQTANRLKALIVPRTGATPEEDSLRRFVRERLSPHKVPRVFEMCAALPRSPLGKLRREALK